MIRNRAETDTKNPAGIWRPPKLQTLQEFLKTRKDFLYAKSDTDRRTDFDLGVECVLEYLRRT